MGFEEPSVHGWRGTTGQCTSGNGAYPQKRDAMALCLGVLSDFCEYITLVRGKSYTIKFNLFMGGLSGLQHIPSCAVPSTI